MTFKTGTFASDFPLISRAIVLLKVMQSAIQSEMEPMLEPMRAFLERIETADPNSPDLSDDDNNESWGHYQFTSGQMTCSSVLTSWSSVGGTKGACRLIAAAIKTCKVARHICFSRAIEPTSYLSDVYLELVVGSLWSLWKNHVCSHLPILHLKIYLFERDKTGTASPAIAMPLPLPPAPEPFGAPPAPPNPTPSATSAPSVPPTLTPDATGTPAPSAQTKDFDPAPLRAQLLVSYENYCIANTYRLGLASDTRGT
jgi:hypothetical protein